MKICFFGIYDPNYSRNRVLAVGFERLGHTVIHCRVDPRVHGGVRKYATLYREYQKIKRESFDHVIVCFPGHTVVWLARILFGKRIIFDAFLSLYDSNVWDRKSYGQYNIRAWRDWLWDKTSCMFARRVLLDTDAHIQYFHKIFGTPISKCIRVWVGANDTVFYPRSVPEETVFTVHFHGSFVPLQGISCIIQAADICKDEDIQFRLVGQGLDLPMIERMARNQGLKRVVFDHRMSVDVVAELMAPAHVVLGIFGISEKTQRVIPNKVYEAMAVGKAIITADTPALRELMPDLREVIGVPAGDARALAAAIRALKTDSERRMRLGLDAREFFEKHLLPEKIVGNLLSAIY